MEPTRLESPETERQLFFDVNHLNINRPLSRGEDFPVEVQHQFDVRGAREKHLQIWSKKLELETASSQAVENQIDETLVRLVDRCQRFQNDCLELQDRTGSYGSMLSIEAFISKLADKYQVTHGEKAQGSTAALKSLHYMLNTMNAHKTLLQILPSQNNYASIICGVVQTFLKASANHYRITEIIGRVITEVNDLVSHAHSLFELYPNKDMRRMATTLYCYIFDFLEKVFKWYESRWHRFKRSFSDDTVEKLSELTVDIKRYVHSLDRKAGVGLMTESRVTSLQVDKIYQKLEMIPLIWAQHTFQGKDSIQDMGRGNALSGGPRVTTLIDRLPSLHVDELNPRLAVLGADSSTTDQGADEEYQDSAAIYVDDRVIQGLQKWLPEPFPRFLWVENLQTMEEQSLSRLIACSIACSARQCSATVLYHACTIPESIETPNDLPRIMAFCSLLQSLNDQCGSFAGSRQASLDPKLPSSLSSGYADDLISSFKDNLARAPPLLVCVIEGFQCLDDPFEDTTHLQRFFQVLRAQGQSVNQDLVPGPSVLKILISTSGHSRTLQEELEPEEICCPDHNPRALLHPGQAAPGRRPIMPNLRLINDWVNSQTPESLS